MKARLLSILYLMSFFVTFSLLWSSNKSVRIDIQRFMPKHWTLKRKLFFVRICAKHGAKDLGVFILWFMVIPALIAGVLVQTFTAIALGSIGGFFVFAIIPIFMTMPSLLIQHKVQTGLRCY